MRWGEGNLLNLGEVVLYVLVESQLAESSKRNLALRPDLGQVEDVPLKLLGLLWRQGLHVNCPAGVFTLLDGLEQILSCEIGVVGSHLTSLGIVEGLDSLVGLQVYLDVDIRAIGLRPLVCVSRVPVHKPVGVWSSPVREELHYLVDGLLVGRL